MVRIAAILHEQVREINAAVTPRDCGCFLNNAGHVGPVSLNRSEQRLLDYVEKHPEERHFWVQKVQARTAASDDRAAAAALESDLWSYFVERSGVVPTLIEHAKREGLRRTSMLNLAEHLLRLWGPIREKKRVPTYDEQP